MIKYGLSTGHLPQIREQILVPDLSVLTMELLAYKRRDFFMFLGLKKIILTVLNATFQCGRYNVQRKFFAHEKLKKKHSKKLLIISPNPFIPRSSPGHSPQPKIDFSYYEILGPEICSLICGLIQFLFTVVCKASNDGGQHFASHIFWWWRFRHSWLLYMVRKWRYLLIFSHLTLELGWTWLERITTKF